MADWSNATWDSIPAYRLSKETVDAFLQGLFGYYEFYTRVQLSLSTFSIQPIELLADPFLALHRLLAVLDPIQIDAGIKFAESPACAFTLHS
jgi:hypothetical protein